MNDTTTRLTGQVEVLIDRARTSMDSQIGQIVEAAPHATPDIIAQAATKVAFYREYCDSLAGFVKDIKSTSVRRAFEDLIHRGVEVGSLTVSTHTDAAIKDERVRGVLAAIRAANEQIVWCTDE
ncbi:hypothetical protein [Aeromicrobium sp. 179-A 4D2 NHS]|uniref:hypothetical protein n=1 Tax=Aeromicrobium sp. 179-A 4D2 NHS TaxID=3142375 RepID=UPI0039A399E4